MELLPKFEHKFDMVFADPPYFLSNNGMSIQSGQIVSVNKGKWDKSEGFEYILAPSGYIYIPNNCLLRGLRRLG